jgi:hypothetical protein
MGKRTKTLAILACVVSTASCYAYWQGSGQDILYKAPAVTDFLGIPFGTDHAQFLTSRKSAEVRPDTKPGGLRSTNTDLKGLLATLHPLLVPFLQSSSRCYLRSDDYGKIVSVECEANTSSYRNYTADQLKGFIAELLKMHPELKENKDKSKGVVRSGNRSGYTRLSGTTKSGVSVLLVIYPPKEVDSEIHYPASLELKYEAATKAEEDRKTRIKKKIEEDGL